jgi:hypothetical protein
LDEELTETQESMLENKEAVAIDERASRLRLKECLAEANGSCSVQYRQMTNDISFRSGEQWDTAHRRKRKNRPCLTMNIVQTYIDRVVNPSRLNPFRIAVEHPELGEELSGAVRAVETRCNAAEAYDISLENAVTGGIGWLLVGIYEESGKTKVRVTAPRNPVSVYIDPWAQMVDGSDADWALVIGYISKKVAEREYGNDIGSAYGDLDCYSAWALPSGSVAEVLLYEKVKDGKFRATKFVGQKPVESSVIECEWLPVVPVYGDIVNLQGGQIKYAGIVHRLRDAQKMVNFYASNEAELAALAPRSPFIAAAGQLEGFSGDWATANSEAHDVLRYNPVSVSGVVVPSPARADNQAQTGGLIASKADSIGMMGRLTGMGDHMWGSGTAESGISRVVAQSMGELATAQYTDNLTKSIRQVGRIVLRLLKLTNEAEVEVVSPDGELTRQPIDWSTIDLDEVHVSVDAGPAYESRKRESAKTLIELAGLLTPEQKALTADILASTLDSVGAKELTRRLRKMLPPEILDEEGENAPDPMAMQALQTAEQTILEQQQTIDRLEGYMRQMQSVIIDNAKDREVDLLQTQIDARVKLAVESMKQEGANQREAAKIQAQTEQDIIKALGNAKEQPMRQVVSSEMPPLVVGPQSIDDTAALEALAAIEAVGAGESPVPSGGFTAQ